MTILRILKKFCFGRAPRARITACMGRKCYLHGLSDDRTAILDAWHVLSCPVRHARALPARPELFASLLVCISFWVGSLRETLLRVLEVLGMSRVRSLKMLPRQHFGNFGAGPRQPMIFGLRGTCEAGRAADTSNSRMLAKPDAKAALAAAVKLSSRFG